MMTNTEIWQRVEDFRTQYAPNLNAEKIPLDLLTFIELELGLLYSDKLIALPLI